MQAKIGKRSMAGGAIAGTVVGVVIAVCLLTFCLYPVIVGRINRQKRQRRDDAEAAVQHAGGDHGAGKGDSQQRTSSSESCKEEVELARGDLDIEPAAGTGTQYQLSRGDSDLISSKFVAQFGEEYMPQDLKDDQPGVLKGTSEDYYRVSIPSEAFGMVTQTEVETEISKSPTPSRASSFTHNVRHMFRRSNSREHTIPGRTSQDDGFGAAGIQRSIKKEGPLAESPIEHIYPTPPAAPITVASRAIGMESGDSDLPKSPPQSPRQIETQHRLSASPPQNPAPGTVNPMDIMPASTQSEHWHKTEHQLFSTSHESPKVEDEVPVASPEPINEAATLSPVANETSDDFDALFHYDDSELNSIIMDGMMSHKQLNLMPTTDLGRLPSNPSEQSTPLPGPAFTDASSQPTPSTQTDTPSPESIIGSDFRSSHSPQITHPATLSAKPHHQFRCDEPGCDQSFDQPHKLKYDMSAHTWEL